MNYDDLIYNLDTLNRIQIYDKIIIRKNIFIINTQSKCRPIYRYIYNHDREKLYYFLLKIIDYVLLDLDKYYIYDLGLSKYNINELNIKNKNEYIIILQKLFNIKLSIDILQETYNSDKEFCKKINLLKNRISIS